MPNIAGIWPDEYRVSRDAFYRERERAYEHEQRMREVQQAMQMAWGPWEQQSNLAAQVREAVSKPKRKFEAYRVDLPKLATSRVGSEQGSQLSEYASLAEELGFSTPDLLIEQFKAFLSDNDIPIFSLSEVVEYMDKKAACESKNQAGWEWRPLRKADERDVTFGQKSKHVHFIDLKVDEIKTASDRYKKGEQKIYDKVIPLHALKKVQMVVRAFGEKIAFFVADYAPAPKIEYADPFLMAIIPNEDLESGKGRFIIDFWDEPNFGLTSMLKVADAK